MFADISGFTALSEKLDPEEVTALMNGCFAKLESIVFAHGGVVDEYLGDCIKAVFGFSPATTNPTTHAVQAAVEMREALYQYNREATLPAPLDIHIGINSGPVVAVVMGDRDHGDFSVMDETVRLAAKLGDISEKGDIFVGPETSAATCEAFEYESLPPIELRPHPTPIPIDRLVATRQARRVKRDSERRQATVVFAEVIGFEALSARLDPIALARVMHELFAVFVDAVAVHGGVVDKFLGEGIMALFGVPNAIENAPQRAVNAAIEIRDRLARFCAAQQLPVPIEVHIGINTGLVIAGDIGGRVKHDFTVMGDAVNLASRLKDAATPGAIFVGPDTHRYTHATFEYRPLEPLRLKGKAQPVPAYELLSVATHVHRSAAARTDLMVFSEIVGREAELATFEAQTARLAAGEGAIVSLVGEAGLGKSRLLAEVFRIAERQHLPVFLGRSLATGRGSSFHPFVDLLRHWARIAEDVGEEAAQAQLDAAMRGVLGPQSDEVFPFIARLMGLHPSGAHAERLAGIEGEALETLILKSMRELLQGIAHHQPTALVFEDLHWADQSSLNLLESLLPLVAECPLLFVHVFRPEFEDTSNRILQLCAERHAVRHRAIRLEPLDAAHAATLIRNLLDIADLPDAVRKLVGQAEGNPFYIEEVVRSLIDEEAVAYRDGRFVVTDKVNHVVIPATIHDVIMARVDRLDERARRLLQIASVIGRHFYYRVIAAVAERDARLDADLVVLKEKQLIQERTTRWEVAVGERSLADELEYMFNHALAQEAVYASILLKTRTELHRKVAETIESLFTERLPEFYATLAYHYTRSAQLQPAEDYLCKAGEAAARAAASSEALHLFREAAVVYDKLHGATGGDRGHRAFLEKNVGLALLNSGQHTESIEHFDHALEWLGEAVPRNTLTQAVRWLIDMAVVLARVYVYQGRPGPVANLDHEREFFKLVFERGHAEVTSAPQRLFLEMATPLRRAYHLDRRLIEQACGMYVSAATIFAYSGLSYTLSRRMMEEAKSLMRDDIHDVFRYRSMAFTFHYLRGDWATAPQLEDTLVEEALRHGMVWDVSLYVGLEMDRRLRRGDFAGARRTLAQLADIRDTYGYAYAGSNHNGMECILLLEARQLQEALRRTERHYEFSRERHEATIVLMTLGLMAKARVLLGDRAGAAEDLRRGDELTTNEGVVSPWHQSIHHVAQLLFDVAALEDAVARGDRSQWGRLKRAGISHARRALGTARKVAKERIETYHLAGRLWWVLGNRRRARQWWERCLEEAARMGARPELARAQLEISRRIGAARLNGVSGTEYVARARQVFSELDLRWDLLPLHGGDADESAPAHAEVA